MITQNKNSQINNKFFNVFVICGCAVFGAGCNNNDFLDLKEYVKDVKERPKGTIKPLPEIKIVEPFVFNPSGLRNPFKPLERADEGSRKEYLTEAGVMPDITRRKEELEMYSLDTLRMVGTLTMKSSLWGLVKTSDGTIHRVQAGNYLGKNHGKIIRIMDDRIELDEVIPKPSGGWIEEQQTLVLAE